MAHLMIDYSANVEARLDMAGLCRALRDAALETGVFPAAGLRVRAVRVDHFAMANDDPQHGFIDLSVRLREGRSSQMKAAATAHIFARLESYCASALASSSLMISMEMRDIDAALSPKTSTIRQYLPGDLT
ncbi:MAG: 5-carboxymethyl-2-hydroxymuconate Delta-isomerase [Maritimibacter sp.]